MFYLWICFDGKAGTKSALEEIEDLCLGNKADRTVDDLSAPENEKSGDRGDTVRDRESLLFIYVNAADFETVCLSGDFSYDRGKHFARTAPCCPEIYENRNI
jgi:hypothetical protein